VTSETVDLETATRVSGEKGRYGAMLSREWEIWGPNGGYLASLALRAVGMMAEIRQPASLYCHFLSSPQFAEVELSVEVLKKGRRSESFSVQMRQQGKAVLQALIRTAADAPGYEHQQVTAPNVPRPQDLKAYDDLRMDKKGPVFKFWNNVEARPTVQKIPNSSEQAVVRDWMRFKPQACFDDLFVDGTRSLILLDTYGWPAVWRTYQDNRFVAPNLDTSVWFHRFSPRSEWLLIDHANPIATRGLLGVQGHVWDSDGKLVATGSAQLCSLPQSGASA
jgi:acyl-CoA thioesterase II